MSNLDPQIPLNQADCLACQTITGTKAVPGGVIYENEHWLADHCIGSLGVGSLVVKTKVHREALWELTPDEASSLGPFLQTLSAAMVKVLGAERVYLSMWVDEQPYHVHLVLQPRYPGRTEAFGLKGLWLQLTRSLLGQPNPKLAEQAANKVRDYLLTSKTS